MEFAAANIWGDFQSTSRTEQGTLDDNANEVILGPKLNHAVRDLANGYNKTLELDSEHKATDERAKLLDLRWGHVEHDGALIQGLGAAMTNFAEVLGANVTKLAESWSGDSYNAFKTAIDKVQAKLAEYGAGATTTGDGLVNAMGQIRQLYQTFADDSANKHLVFDDVSKPHEWHKMTDHDDYSGFKLAEACPMWHIGGICTKDNDEQRSIITDRFVSERRWEICKNDPCEGNAGRVIIMYRDMVDECQGAIDRIQGKLDRYYGAVKTTVDGVSDLYDVALSNVYNLGHAEAFTSLRVIGGQPAGGPPPGGGGYPVDGGSYPAGGGSPGPVAVSEPPPAVEDPVVTDPAAVETPPVDDAAAGDEAAGESVRIKDGDRTIGVTSPDGEGHVKVTVEDGAGGTKTYSLDFNAASSGMPSDPEAGHIPARTDGKCVIEDGALTITAERPLFSPDSIKLVVDDGSGSPRTYTLDFDDQEDAAPAAGQAAAGQSPDQPAGQVPDQVAPGQARPDQTASQSPNQVALGQAPPDQTAGQIPSQATSQPPNQATTGADVGVPAGQGANGTPAHLTSPQAAWHGGQSGSVSGVLVPDQPGEAELAKAPDDAQPEVGGMAGAGLPMVGAPAASGAGGETVRAGSGWSVHGDLFDNGGPVYSMHGVLGDDDAQE